MMERTTLELRQLFRGVKLVPPNNQSTQKPSTLPSNCWSSTPNKETTNSSVSDWNKMGKQLEGKPWGSVPTVEGKLFNNNNKTDEWKIVPVINEVTPCTKNNHLPTKIVKSVADEVIDVSLKKNKNSK